MIGVFRNIYRLRIEGEGVAENQWKRNCTVKRKLLDSFGLKIGLPRLAQYAPLQTHKD